MSSNPPVLLRQSLIVGMRNYQKQKGGMKELALSHSDAKRMKDYLRGDLEWPLPIILTDNAS